MAGKLLSDAEIRDRFLTLMTRLEWNATEAAVQLLGSKKRQPEVSKWLSLDRPIPPERLAEIAAVAGESPAYFLPDAPPDDERREKLIAAKWMVEMARRLKEEAVAQGPPATPSDEEDLAALQRLRNAEQNEGGKGSARKKKTPRSSR